MSYAASWALEPLFYEAPYPEKLDELGRPPRPYQHAGVEYALGRKHCMIGDQPGVGKTWQGTLISNAIRAKRTLVICPASLILNWEREIWMTSLKENVYTHPILKGSHGVSNTADYVILSYSMLRNKDILNSLLDLKWDHCILDEAHKMKNPQANTVNTPICALDMLPTCVGRYTLLSGTPMPNGPIEIYNAARLCDWGAIDFMSEEEFRKAYYAEGGGFVNGIVWDEDLGANVKKLHWSEKVRNKPQNLPELNHRLRSSFMIRRLKRDVMPDLPPRTWQVIPLNTTPAMRKALREDIVKQVENFYLFSSNKFSGSVPIDGAVSTARRLLGESKAPEVAKFIEELMAEGTEKLVVGAFNRSVLLILREKLEKYGLVYMDGSTSPRAKQRAVDLFQGEKAIRIILGQMQVLGEGWTLTAAYQVINAEPDWVPGNNEQLFDRVDRYGQIRGTIGYLPVIPDSMDERILNNAIKKDKSINIALDTRN